jgi:hypothetical protein
MQCVLHMANGLPGESVRVQSLGGSLEAFNNYAPSCNSKSAAVIKHQRPMLLHVAAQPQPAEHAHPDAQAAWPCITVRCSTVNGQQPQWPDTTVCGT